MGVLKVVAGALLFPLGLAVSAAFAFMAYECASKYLATRDPLALLATAVFSLLAAGILFETLSYSLRGARS